MQFNRTNVTDDATVQVNKPMEEIYYNQVFLQSSTPFSDCPADSDAMLHTKRAEPFQQEIEQTLNKLYSKGHRSKRMPLTTRREKNRERERKRQMRLKEAFNVLRSVIPDFFSKREPGDRLSRIQTLRVAKKYIASLYELLETS